MPRRVEYADFAKKADRDAYRASHDAYVAHFGTEPPDYASEKLLDALDALDEKDALLKQARQLLDFYCPSDPSGWEQVTDWLRDASEHSA